MLCVRVRDYVLVRGRAGGRAGTCACACVMTCSPIASLGPVSWPVVDRSLGPPWTGLYPRWPVFDRSLGPRLAIRAEETPAADLMSNRLPRADLGSNGLLGPLWLHGWQIGLLQGRCGSLQESEGSQRSEWLTPTERVAHSLGSERLTPWCLAPSRLIAGPFVRA